MEATLLDCPLFTSRHAHHSVAWCIPGVSMPTLCIACATERLEKRGELSLHVKKVLGELQALLDSGNTKLLDILNSDRRVTEHLCGLLFNLVHSQDASVAQSSIDVLMALLTLTKLQDLHMKLLQKSVQTMMTARDFLNSLPLLTFLGRLLHSVPSLCTEVTQAYGGFLEFLLGGMTYSDEMVKSATVYILVQVCSRTPHHSLPLPLVQNMCRYISSNLASAKSHNLIINLLGFVRHLLQNGMYAQCLIQADQLNSQAKGSTFASAFKRVLLSQDELLQLSGVQCIAGVLTHHTDYARVLLSADIAEFMLEALSSKNELLLLSLFSCLNSLASVDDFYSKCHVIYGVDPIATGLCTSVRLRNYDAAQLGFSLLGKILSRQPSGLPLFSSHQSLNGLLELINTALQTQSPSVVIQATSTLSGLLSVQHVPSGFALSAFIPLFALLLHHIEPLTKPTSTLMVQQQQQQQGAVQDREEVISLDSMSPAMKRLFTEVLAVIEKANRFALRCIELTTSNVSRAPLVHQCDSTFLTQTFEESLLPAFLIHVDQLDQPEPCASVLSIAVCQFSLLSGAPLVELVERLATSGFIQLVLDMKAKFGVNPTQRYQTLCSCANQFLERLCFHLEGGGDLSTSYVKDILHEALPDINCSLLSSLQYLCKAAGGRPSLQSSTNPVGTKSTGLQTVQFATLALLYYTHTHDNTYMYPSKSDLYTALNSFLSLNPNTHMLPPTTLRHLTLLYALCDNQSEGSDNILVRGLQMVPNPSSLFVPHPLLLGWAFRQSNLVNTVAKTWLGQWLELIASDCSDHNMLMDKLLDVAKITPSLMGCLLDVLMSDARADLVNGTLKVLDHLSSIPSHSLEVYRSFEKVLLMQRVEPLSDSSTCAILKALTKAQEYCKSQAESVPDLKLIYQVANIVTRTGQDNGDDDTSLQVARYGMEFLVGSLTDHSDNRIPALLLNNSVFLQKVTSILTRHKTPKSHTLLSASAILLLTELIGAQHRNNIMVSHSSSKPTLPIPNMVSALLSPLIPVQVAGLQFWTAIFSSGGKTGCFVLHDPCATVNSSGDGGLKHVRLLLFLVQNCLVKGIKSVQETAAHCFVALVNYTSSVVKKPERLTSCQHWCGILLNHLTSVHHTSTLPHRYVSCLTNLLSSNLVPSVQLKSVAQLLYKVYLTHDSESLPGDVHSDLSISFISLQKLDKSVFTDEQWTTLHSVKYGNQLLTT